MQIFLVYPRYLLLCLFEERLSDDVGALGERRRALVFEVGPLVGGEPLVSEVGSLVRLRVIEGREEGRWLLAVIGVWPSAVIRVWPLLVGACPLVRGVWPLMEGVWLPLALEC